MKSIIGSETFQLAELYAFAYSPILLVMVVLLSMYLIKSKKVYGLLAASPVASSFLMNFSLWKKWAKVLLLGMGFLCVYSALLRPQWGKEEKIISQEGRGIFIALDFSRSMYAEDCKPNRLLCARKKIEALLSQLSFERVGLILFSGSAFIQCPLTTDYETFLLFLNQVEAEFFTSGFTDLAKPIDLALKAFKRSGHETNKLLILCTDGEDFSSSTAEFKQKALDEHMHIFALGVGSEQGAPIPCLDEQGKRVGYLKDKDGAIVISRLNEPGLRSLVADSGGEYVALTEDDRDIKKLVKMITCFDKEMYENHSVIT
ncbi:MAG: VWA domain-containing protein, partial [Candidatus Babeliales bacterium]